MKNKLVLLFSLSILGLSLSSTANPFSRRNCCCQQEEIVEKCVGETGPNGTCMAEEQDEREVKPAYTERKEEAVLETKPVYTEMKQETVVETKPAYTETKQETMTETKPVYTETKKETVKNTTNYRRGLW